LPGEGVYVFDACAVIALLQAEVGASLVSEFLKSRQRCLLHAINACEIYYDLYRRDGQEIADGLQEVLAGYGLELIEEVPSSLEDGRQAQGRLAKGLPGRLLRTRSGSRDLRHTGDDRPSRARPSGRGRSLSNSFL